MTDKELKRLSRKDLLQILIAQMEENEKLKQQISEMQKETENRILVMENAGSIAQAALQLNGVFEAAEQAAQQYLDSIKSMEREMKMKTITAHIEEMTKKSFEENSGEVKEICEE